MWSTRIEELAYGRAVSVDFEKRPVKFSEVLRRWQDDPVFRAFFIALLADAPFSAFRWWLFYLFVFGLFLGPLAEELGWRGFLLPRLLNNYSPLQASVILGLIGTAWAPLAQYPSRLLTMFFKGSPFSNLPYCFRKKRIA
jgi:membrane protease YdiL (CAAX protease family)